MVTNYESYELLEMYVISICLIARYKLLHNKTHIFPVYSNYLLQIEGTMLVAPLVNPCREFLLT